jgi:ribosomal protein S18 acetylase RimI-like enzyme
MIQKSANLTGEEKDCAIELLDIYLADSSQEEYLFLAATDDSDRPIGFTCYGGTTLADSVYDLYWILVDPDHRGRSVGAGLLAATMEILKGLGARLVVAETSGSEAYSPARGLYLKSGFAEEARIKDYYKPGDDLVVFTKRFE